MYDIDYNLTINQLIKLSGNPNLLIPTNNLIEVSSSFEKGLIKENEFRDTLKLIYKLPHINDDNLDGIWNALLIGLKHNAFFTLELLSKKYNLVLLSNTNAIHYNKFKSEIYGFEHIFSKLYFSHLIGMRKPDLEIYNYVCSDSGFNKEETLFIDDSLENIEGAIMTNLKVYNCKRNGELSELYNTIEIIAHTS